MSPEHTTPELESSKHALSVEEAQAQLDAAYLRMQEAKERETNAPVRVPEVGESKEFPRMFAPDEKRQYEFSLQDGRAIRGVAEGVYTDVNGRNTVIMNANGQRFDIDAEKLTALTARPIEQSASEVDTLSSQAATRIITSADVPKS